MHSEKIEGDPVRTVETREDAIEYLLEAIHVHNESHGIEKVGGGGAAEVEGKKWGFPLQAGMSRGGIVLIIDKRRFRIEVCDG